jgi:thioredoxin-related protein
MVDRLERELEGQARVVRLSVFDKVGREIAQRYNVTAVPTFLVFDGDGNLLGRQVGIPDRPQLVALIASPVSHLKQAST